MLVSHTGLGANPRFDDHGQSKRPRVIKFINKKFIVSFTNLKILNLIKLEFESVATDILVYKYIYIYIYIYIYKHKHKCMYKHMK